MNEPLEQSMTGDTGADETRQGQSQELANRLLRRRTEPVGVINTHHPLQMYDRTAGFVARRFAMLDHWRTRYADAENTAQPKGDVGSDFALISTPLAALREKAAAPQISRAAAPPASPRSVTPGSSAQTIAQGPTQAAPTAAPPLMRVMRRAARPADAGHPSSTPGSHSPVIREGSMQGSNKAPGETPANSRSIEIAEPAPGDSTPMTLARAGGEGALAPADTQVQRRRSGDSNSDAGSGDAGKSADSTTRAMTTEAPAPASVKGRVVDVADGAIQSSPLQSVPPDTLPITVARAQRKEDEAPGLLKGKILAAPVADVAPQRAPFPATTSITERVGGGADAVGSPGAARSPSPAREERMPDQASGQGAESSSGVSRLPLAPALIQRQAAHGETRGPSSVETQAKSREDRSDNSTAASAPQTPGGKPAAATEIADPPSTQASPKIVWRKGAESSSTASPAPPSRKADETPGLLKGKILAAPVADVAPQRAPFPATTSITERVGGGADAVGSPGAARSPSPAREERMPDQASGQGAESSSGVSRLPLASASIQRQAAPGETRGPSSVEIQAQSREDRSDNSSAASVPQTPGGKPAAATEIADPPSAQVSPRIVWRKGAESSSVVGTPGAARPPSPARETRMPDEASGQGTEPSSGVSRLPLAPALIQRQAAHGETRGPSSVETQAQSREDRGGNSTAASAPQTPGGKPAVAMEIPDPSSAQAPPKIVWRKGAESSSTTTPSQSVKRENITPVAPMIASQNEGGADWTAETFTSASPQAPSDIVRGGVDVEQLAEQVSRLLARQLQIERERRGIF